jgi:hypothetical protein
MFSFNFGKYFTLISAVGVVIFALASETVAQPKSTLPPASTTPNTSSFTGNVENYLLNREGLVDGLLLDNGIQVKFPPHMSDRLIEIAQPGTEISVQGEPGVPTNYGQEIKAYSIANVATGETVVEQPPMYKQPRGYREYNNLSETGNVEHWLVGRRGEIKGMILSSGTQVKFPPHVGERLAFMVSENAEIEVEGFGTENEYGKLIEASILRVDGQPLNL